MDVLPGTLNIDPALVRAAITNKTKAIMPVHFAGLAADMSAIVSIAQEHGLKVVEDAAHALPCVVNGVAVGNLQTDAAVFSFYANKTITTGKKAAWWSRAIRKSSALQNHAPAWH